ncbi:MAG TPA: hypothetical protein VD970_00655 [Acetobacteraceae bacterium]|nr:hypothetical protein [Acetobacteraceae bacterium]
MPKVELPLSGDVSQAINPWTFWFMLQGAQIGLFNVNLGQSADPALEREILDEVGSYGRQIGRIGEVLEILVRRADLLNRSDLTGDEREAIEDFLLQQRQVDAAKRRRRRGQALPGARTPRLVHSP